MKQENGQSPRYWIFTAIVNSHILARNFIFHTINFGLVRSQTHWSTLLHLPKAVFNSQSTTCIHQLWNYCCHKINNATHVHNTSLCPKLVESCTKSWALCGGLISPSVRDARAAESEMEENVRVWMQFCDSRNYLWKSAGKWLRLMAHNHCSWLAGKILELLPERARAFKWKAITALCTSLTS